MLAGHLSTYDYAVARADRGRSSMRRVGAMSASENLERPERVESRHLISTVQVHERSAPEPTLSFSRILTARLEQCLRDLTERTNARGVRLPVLAKHLQRPEPLGIMISQSLQHANKVIQRWTSSRRAG
jgi:hypothetical protein